jgi:hypothetical protein
MKMIENLTEQEIDELMREKEIADYQEYMHDLEEENQKARAQDAEMHSGELDQVEMQQVLQQVHKMSLPQLKLVLEHVDHEVQLILYEAEANKNEET